MNRDRRLPPVQKLYLETVDIDDSTGKPHDYHSLFAGYKYLVAASAGRSKIPYQDVEDAVQEVQLKFWLKNGLDLYKEDHGTRFASMYRSWTAKFMLQERDKVIRSGKVVASGGTTQEILSHSDELPYSFEEDFVDNEYLSQWIQAAESALEASKRPYLVKLLHLCLEAAESGRGPSRDDIVATLGVKPSATTRMLNHMRNILTDAGLGVESLYA